ncbi:hypothetical protein GCM10010129_77140 [Streptomyces fumigatiscleroticus]|nr:hypothetical protein GCM10010129_77140 [Streptomyces fumigatiscleroticus]
MAEPYVSKYDPHPLTPDAASGGDSTPDPDAGKDLSYLDPEVTVAWDAPPSFNLPPKQAPDGGGGGQSNEVADSGAIRMDGPSVRAAESAMLGDLRALVADYQTLRSKVLGLQVTDFGPPPPKDTNVPKPNWGGVGNSSGAPSSPDEHDPEGEQALSEFAEEFFASIKPAMEKVLWQVANSLELSGQYLALVNKAGQGYAQIDRACRFPEPPAGSVVH